MKVDGTGFKNMSVLASELIRNNTTSKERNLLAIKYDQTLSLIDKLLQGNRNYTEKNSRLVVSLFELAIKNKQ